VFEFVANPRNSPRYISSIKRIVSGPEGIPEQGQSWQVEVDFLGQRSQIQLRLHTVQPPDLVRFTLEGEPKAGLSLHLSEAQTPSRTLVALTLVVRSVPSILLRALMDHLLAADMQRLKQTLER